MLRLERDLQLAVKESDRLRLTLEERESSHKNITAEMEHTAKQLRAECQHLHHLVEPSAEELPPRFMPSIDVQKELNVCSMIRL